LAETVREVLKTLLCETGLIFIGYGGNDVSIAEILNELPSNALPWGIYWVGSHVPDGNMGGWLEERNAVWVNQNDFDELMLLVLNEFGLRHPGKDRFDKLMDTYFETFKELKGRVETRLKKEEVRLLREALERAVQEFGSWWAVELEAEKYEKENPEKADIIYQEGIKKFSDNAALLGDYAVFLKNIRKDYDKAEEYYRKSLEIDPHGANNLGNYALFLHEIRKKYDKAEEYYRKSLEIDPHGANHLGNYALFLRNIRKDYDKAEEYYRKSLEIDPHGAIHLGNYACLLLSRGNKEGFLLAEKAIELARKDLSEPLHKSLLLECLFYQYAHSTDEHLQKRSLKEIKILLKEGTTSPGWNLSDNVKRATQDGHPHPDFLDKLARVISEEIDIQKLDNFNPWQDA